MPFVKAWTATQSGTSTTFPITVPTGGVALGNRVIIVLNGNGTGTLAATPATDTRGNTWNIDRQSTATTGGQIAGSKITTALLAGDTITVTGTTSIAGRVAVCLEVSGLADAPVDIENGGTNTNTAPIFTEPTLDTGQADIFLVGFIGLSSADATRYTAVGQSATEAGRVGGLSSRALLASYKTLSTIQKPVVSGTLSTSTAWRTGYQAYKIASATSHALTASGTATPTGSAALSLSGTSTNHAVTASGTATPTGAAAMALLGRCLWRMVGAEGLVSTETVNATSVRLRLSDDAAGSVNVRWTSAETPNSLGVVKIATLNNHTADIYYRVAMTNASGVETLDSMAVVGCVPALTANVSACFSSCCDATDSTAMVNARLRGDPFWFERGDQWYNDLADGTVAQIRIEMRAKLMAPNHEPLYATKRVLISASDHDVAMQNNGTGASHPTEVANYNSVYREFIPTPTLPTTGHYYAYRVPNSRVLILNMDSRTFMTTIGAAESSSKTIWGDTQEAWWKAQIDATDASEIWTLGDTPFVGPALVSDDGWRGYDTFRQRIVTYATGKTNKQFSYFAGDMHALAVAVGPGPITSYHAAPLNNEASIKSSGYLSGYGPYPASGSAVVEQYGRIQLTEGSGSYTRTYNGYSADNTLRVGPHVTTVTTAHALTASGTATPIGSAALTIAPRTYALTASGTATPTGAAALRLTHQMAGGGTATPTGSAALTILARTYALTASGTATTSGSAALNIVGGQTNHVMVASGTATPTGAAALKLKLRVSASGTVTPIGSAALTLPPRTHALTASGTATASGAADLVFPWREVRDLLITGVTEPVSAWQTAEPALAWASEGFVPGWATAEPVPDWLVALMPLRDWLSTEPGLPWLPGEPAVALTATEPTI